MVDISKDACKISLAPERGAIVTSLRVAGREVLFLDRSTFEDPSKNVRGGIPVLFPLCGPIDGPSYQWDGSLYSLKQHGFARTMPWVVVEQHSDRVRMELRDSEETRSHYPFDFTYRLDFQALPNGLRIDQKIRNRGKLAMPAQFGFHPYFLVGEKSALEFSLPVTSYRDNKSEASGPYAGFDFSRDEIDWLFPEPSARRASFTDLMRGVTVAVEYGEAYGALVFWSLRGSPFVCLEPWSSSRLAFPHGPDVHLIPPGEQIATHVSIEVS
jgi:galactose mutarotase-like enzyme